MKEIKSFNADDYDDGPFKLEEEMSCKEFDHIIPYSKGGHSDESNIRVTCSKCNKNKSNKISEVVR